MKIDRESLFRWIANTSKEKSKFLLVAASILAGISVLLIARLDFHSDVANLLPSSAPRTQAFVKFLKEFGAADSLFIIMERKSGQEMGPFLPFAESLAEKLMATGEITEIQGRMDPAVLEKILGELIPRAFLYLTEEDLVKLQAKLTEEGIRKEILERKAGLHSPLGSFNTSWVARDPLDLWSIFQKHLPLGSSQGAMDAKGIFLSPDRKMLLLIARPKGSAVDVDYDEKLLQKVREAEQAAKEAFGKKEPLASDVLLQDLTLGLAGGYMNALEDRRMIRRELIMNFSVSLLAVLALFFFAFRRWTAIFYAIVPLMLSPLLTLGFFSPFLGRLSESIGAFSAIILGLSIDFIILLYSRYLEERTSGLDLPRALEKSLIQTGPGIFTGAVTTAAAYYILLFSDFRGIRELGALTGTGILFSMLCAFILFPALLALGRGGKKERASFRGMSAFDLESINIPALRRPGLVLFISAALSMAASFFAFQVKINNDPRSLRPPGHSALVWEGRMQEKMEQGQETVIILKKSPSLNQALECQGDLKRKLEQAALTKVPLAGFETLASFIPPPSRQRRNLEWIAAQEKEAFDPNRVEKSLRRTLEEEGLRVEPFEPAITMLRKMITNREMLAVEAMQGSPLGPLFERFLKKEGDSYWTAAYLHIRPDFWQDENARSFLKGLSRSTPGLMLTGSKLVQMELEDLMAREAWLILVLSFLAVSALIYLDFRSLRLTLLSLIPVILASIWTLGIMGLLGMDLNFMNLIVFSMVLGIGVDYGIHILHRLQESRDSTCEEDLRQVSRGVILAALTTLAGFGSLVFSGYPGLRSMGAVALMGVGFSALLALTLVPCLMKRIGR